MTSKFDLFGKCIFSFFFTSGQIEYVFTDQGLKKTRIRITYGQNPRVLKKKNLILVSVLCENINPCFIYNLALNTQYFQLSSSLSNWCPQLWQIKCVSSRLHLQTSQSNTPRRKDEDRSCIMCSWSVIYLFYLSDPAVTGFSPFNYWSWLDLPMCVS